MLTKSIDLSEVQAHLKDLLSLLVSGTEIILTEGNKPIARLVPFVSRTAGLHSGSFWTSDDFDEPLPEAFWARAA